LRDHSERKVNKYAFSGGQDTVDQQRRLGGDPDVDVAYQYLSFFTDYKHTSVRSRLDKQPLMTRFSMSS